ncbi:TRAM domain-containing protein [Desulfurispira natronophila]|uniref:23S rRNA (Uracil1939-C5)-methyltransferase n=1 Tax=Desulfurispira natronophila TaxID=682562 RepID=A0A7W7Y314_9BACT|nr:23S rRNA (uracil1939-C5)-methyltransferase [Desulfurispira natronophila]
MDILDIDIVKYAPPGIGMGYGEDRAVFVPAAMPGERVRVEVLQRKRRYIRARLVEVLLSSERRISPRCPYYLECGGCDLMHLDYDEQLHLKKQMLHEVLKGQGVDVSPSLTASTPWHYRHRAQLKVRRAQVGFFARHSNTVVNVKECLVLAESLNQAREKIATYSLPDGDCHLLASRNGEVAATFRGKPGSLMLPFSHTVDENYGFGAVTLDSGGFAQSNPHITTAIAHQLAQLCRDQRIWEGYCGSGTFSLPLATVAVSLQGWEVVAPAAKLARRNISRHGLDSRAHFYCGDADNAAIPSDCDTIVVDPPRSGLGRGIIRQILSSGAQQLVYVSCNPATLARDLRNITDNSGFVLEGAQGYDMYPQTTHLEVIAELRRNGQGD